ncbi:hypothetical protein GOP47_0029463 [Adiantum capillus-veneris]|nr:hypothetical protein GOP47_0029463 [Adiantum capillus-veneris]
MKVIMVFAIAQPTCCPLSAPCPVLFHYRLLLRFMYSSPTTWLAVVMWNKPHRFVCVSKNMNFKKKCRDGGSNEQSEEERLAQNHAARVLGSAPESRNAPLGRTLLFGASSIEFHAGRHAAFKSRFP